MHNDNNPKKETEQQVISLYAAKVPVAEICRRTGVACWDFYRILSRNGITTRFKADRQRDIEDIQQGFLLCRTCHTRKPLSEMSHIRGEPLKRCFDCTSARRPGSRRFAPPSIDHLSDPEWAYLAGLIDGEGHVSLLRSDRGSGKAHGFEATIQISNTSSALFALREQYRIGTVQTRKKHIEGWKDCHIWCLPPETCRVILPKLLPYLRIRKPQAEIVLEASLLQQTQKRGAKINADWETYHQRMTDYFNSLRALNKRGKGPLSI